MQPTKTYEEHLRMMPQVDPRFFGHPNAGALLGYLRVKDRVDRVPTLEMRAALRNSWLAMWVLALRHRPAFSHTRGAGSDAEIH